MKRYKEILRVPLKYIETTIVPYFDKLKQNKFKSLTLPFVFLSDLGSNFVFEVEDHRLHMRASNSIRLIG